jgi:hypothetical protein
MTESQIKQLQHIIDLEGWNVIQDLLREDMADVLEGGYEEIALNVLAKNKAKGHINLILNKINSLKEIPIRKSESFK